MQHKNLRDTADGAKLPTKVIFSTGLDTRGPCVIFGASAEGQGLVPGNTAFRGRCGRTGSQRGRHATTDSPLCIVRFSCRA